MRHDVIQLDWFGFIVGGSMEATQCCLGTNAVRWLITLRVEIAAEGTRGRAFLINDHIICSLCYILNPNGGALAFFCQIPKKWSSVFELVAS